MTPEMMARVVMENYDPQFAARTAAGDVVVGGFNFGTGSSREQAVTALKCKGIPLVIAGSFSQTYLRNAFNNGFLCIESPELVKRLRSRFEDPMCAGSGPSFLLCPLKSISSASTIRYAEEEFPFPSAGQRAAIVGHCRRNRELGSARSWPTRSGSEGEKSYSVRLIEVLGASLHGKTYYRNDARRRDRKPGVARGDYACSTRSALMPSIYTPISAGSAGLRKATPFPSAPSIF